MGVFFNGAPRMPMSKSFHLIALYSFVSYGSHFHLLLPGMEHQNLVTEHQSQATELLHLPMDTGDQ